MDQENEIREMWQIIRPYRFFIPLCGVILAAVGLFGQLGSPKVYQAEALVSVPQIAGNDSRDTGLVFVTVAETRAVSGLLKLRLDKGDDPELAADSVLQRLRLVRIDDVRGSDGYFKMTVRTTGDPRSALAALDRLLKYLNSNGYLMSRYETKKTELEAGLKAADLALGSTLREAELNGLRDRQSSFKAKLALVQNYKYVDRPCVRTGPVSPRPWRNFFLFGFLGLLLGVMLALLGHFFKIVSRGA